MRPRTNPRPRVPTDEEILAYDNVPVPAAAAYLGMAECRLRLALREQRAPFGFSVRGDAYTFTISPGGLVKFKREGCSCLDYDTIASIVRDSMRQVAREEIQELKAEMMD